VAFVEWLRVRRASSIFAIVVASIVGVALLSTLWALYHHGGGTLDLTDDRHGGRLVHSLGELDFTIPFSILVGLAGYLAVIFATIVGPSLNKENLTGYAFTKPIARERLALTYFAVDAAGILGFFVFSIALMALALVILGVASKLVLDGSELRIGVTALGAAFMWYGLLQLITSGLRFAAGMFIGISWGAAWILLAFLQVTFFGPFFHWVIVALNYLNPLAYYSSFSVVNKGLVMAVSQGSSISSPTAVALSWSIAVAACAIAAFNWKRVEV